MKYRKFTCKIKRNFGEYPLIIVIDFLTLNEQLLMLNFNKLFRSKILKYYQCKVLKCYCLGLKKFLNKFKIIRANQIRNKFNNQQINFFMYMAKIYKREFLFSDNEKIKLEETLLSKYIKHNRFLFFENTKDSCFHLEKVNHIVKLFKLSTLSNKPTRNSIIWKQSIKVIEEVLFLQSSTCKGIFTLSFKGVCDAAFSIIGEVLANLPLTAIGFIDVISTDNFKILFEALKINSHVHKLEISYLCGKQIEGVAMESIILDLLQINERLKDITIHENIYRGLGVGEVLAGIINSNTTLQKIKFNSSIQFSIGRSRSLVWALGGNNSLLALDLSRNRINDETCKFLEEILKTNSKLQELNLSSNNIRELGCKRLAEGLELNSSLLSLDLSYNRINDMGCKFLGEAFENNPTLQELNLSNNRIIYFGCKLLADGLEHNSSLLSLDLRCNHLDDKGCMILREALKKNKSLKNLI